MPTRCLAMSQGNIVVWGELEVQGNIGMEVVSEVMYESVWSQSVLSQ